MRAVKVLVLAEYDAQLSRGIGHMGEGLTKLAASTIEHRRSAMGPADPSAPPLTPARELSRTRAWVTARVVGMTIRVSWPEAWARILRIHKKGGRYLPIRDVWGLAPEGRMRVVQAGTLWWLGFIEGRPVVAPRAPRPGVAARPAAAEQPAYRPKDVALHGTRPPTTRDVAIGGHIYTLGKGAAKELIGAVKAGRFTGFRSYAR